MSRSIIHDHVQLSLNSGHDVKNVIYPENTESDVLITSRANIGNLTDLIMALGELAFYNAEDIIINDIIPPGTYTKLSIDIAAGITSIPEGALYVVPDDYEDFDSATQIKIGNISAYSDDSTPVVGDYVVKTEYRSDVTFSSRKIMEILENLKKEIGETYVTLETFWNEINNIKSIINQLGVDIDVKIEQNYRKLIDEHIRPLKTRLSELDDYLDFGSIFSSYYELDTAYIRNYFIRGRSESGITSYPVPFQNYGEWLKSISLTVDDTGSTQIKEIVPLNRKWTYIPIETLYSIRNRENTNYNVTAYQDIDRSNTVINTGPFASYNLSIWSRATSKYAEKLFTHTNGNNKNDSVFGDLCAIKAAILRGEDVDSSLLESIQPANTKIIMHSYKKVEITGGIVPDGVYRVVDNIGMQFFMDSNNTWKNNVLMNINTYWNFLDLLNGTKTTSGYIYDDNGNITGTTQNAEQVDTEFTRLISNHPELREILTTMHTNYMNSTHGAIDEESKTIEYFYIMGDVYDVQVGDYVREIDPNREEDRDDYVDISDYNSGCVSYKEVREDIHCGIIYAGGFVTPFALNKDYQTFDVNVDTTTLPPLTNLADIYPTLGSYYWPFPCTGIIVPDMLKMHNKSRTHQITISDSGIKTSNTINLANDQRINVFGIGSAVTPTSNIPAYRKQSEQPGQADELHNMKVSIEAKYKVEVCANYKPNSANNTWMFCYYCAPAKDSDREYLTDTTPWNLIPDEDKWKGRMLLNNRYLPADTKRYDTYLSDLRHTIGFGYTLLIWSKYTSAEFDKEHGVKTAHWDFMPKRNTSQALDESNSIYMTGVSMADEGSRLNSCDAVYMGDVAYGSIDLMGFWRDVLFNGTNPFNNSPVLLIGANCGDSRWSKYDMAIYCRESENSSGHQWVPDNATYRITRIASELSKADLSIEASNNHFKILAKFL